MALAGESEWVRNVRAARGRAVIRRRRARPVRLVEIPANLRPPIISQYLRCGSERSGSKAAAQAARYYFGLNPDPSLAEIRAVAGYYPVFRITYLDRPEDYGLEPRNAGPEGRSGTGVGDVTGAAMSPAAFPRLQNMSMTTRITSVTVEVEVEDQDRALAFYRDILGCVVRADVEVWPGARWLEVAPRGSEVGIALLTRASGLPLGVRYGTADADDAHERLVGAGVQPHQDVLRTDYAPPMFTLADPDGNTVVLIEDQESAPQAG